MEDKPYVYIDMVDTAILCGLDIKPSRAGILVPTFRCR